MHTQPTPSQCAVDVDADWRVWEPPAETHMLSHPTATPLEGHVSPGSLALPGLTVGLVTILSCLPLSLGFGVLPDLAP